MGTQAYPLLQASGGLGSIIGGGGTPVAAPHLLSSAPSSLPAVLQQHGGRMPFPLPQPQPTAAATTVGALGATSTSKGKNKVRRNLWNKTKNQMRRSRNFGVSGVQK